MGLLWPHTRGTAAAARSQKCLMPQGPLAQLQFPVGLGPGGPTCRLLGAVRPRRSLRGLREAWQPSLPARRAAHITSLDPQFLCLGGWQKIYCTSDSGTWQGLAGAGEDGGGTRLGDRARVRLSYGPSAGTSVFPEGLSAGPGQPPGVSAGLGVSARVRAGHLCKRARVDWA